jgi:hypothetical protein
LIKKQIAFVGNKGETIKFIFSFSKVTGKLISGINKGTGKKLAFSQAQRYYNAKKKGVVSLAEARGHKEEVIGTPVEKELLKIKKPVGRPRKKKPITGISKKSEITLKYHTIIKQIMFIRGCVRREAQRIYRWFRDSLSSKVKDNPNAFIMSLQKAYAHGGDALYGVIKIEGYIAEDDDGEPIVPEDVIFYITLEEIYEDAVFERFTFDNIRSEIMFTDSIMRLTEDDYEVIFIGVAAYDRHNKTSESN